MRKTVLLLCVMFLGIGGFAADTGDELYKSAKCTNCHGTEGNADTPLGKKLQARPLRDPAVAKLSDADFIAIVTQGKGKMPAYKGTLTSDQIKLVAAYVRKLSR